MSHQSKPKAIDSMKNYLISYISYGSSPVTDMGFLQISYVIDERKTLQEDNLYVGFPI